jgi:hypothetical protein
VFNMVIVESQLQESPTLARGKWSASRFVQDATTELACLTGTAADEGDYIVNLARTVQLILTMLQVMHLVRRFDDSQMAFIDRKRIMEFGDMVLRREPDSWYLM